MTIAVVFMQVVVEVRKEAAKDSAVLSEGLETIRRAIVAEGCYPSRLVSGSGILGLRALETYTSTCRI